MSDVRTLDLLLRAADHVAPMKAQNANAAQADRNMAPSKSPPVSSSSPTPMKRKLGEEEMGSLPSDEEVEEGEEDTQYDNDHFVELADEARRAAGESRLTLAQPLPWLPSSAFTAPSAYAHVGGMTGMMLPGAAPMLAAVPGVNPCFDRRYDTGMPPQAPSAPMQMNRPARRPCTSCRVAKILCDRQLPCTRCVRLNMVCQAPAHVRRGRPPGRRWSCLSNQKLEPSALGLPSATSLTGAVPGVGGVLGLDVHVSQLQRMPASTGVFDTALHPERHHHPAAAPFGVAPANMTNPAAWFPTDPRLNPNMTNPNMTFSAAGAPLPPSEYAQPLRPPAHFTATVIAVLPPTASTVPTQLPVPSHSVSASVHGGNFFASAAPQLPAPAPLPVPVDYSVGALRAQLLQLGVLPCI